MLANEIETLKKRGFTIEHIAEMLRGEGMDIATPSLKIYLRQLKDKQKKQRSQSTDTVSNKEKTKNTQQVKPVVSGFVVKEDSEEI